jgi:chloramphenicol 3-O-phosphotransferase
LQKGEFAMYYRTLFFLVIIASSYCFGMDVLSEGKHIIFLNGTTTAGKSSIASKLKEQLEAQSLRVEVLAIDDFMGPKVLYELVMNRLNPFNIFVPNTDLITEPAGRRMLIEAQIKLCDAARSACDQGKVVIIDSPAHRFKHIALYQQLLNKFAVTWVLVYCPVSTLVERVIHRNETAGIAEQRSILQALDQFKHLYSRASDNHFIDTLSQETLFATCDRANKQHAIMQERIPDFLKGIQNAICPDSCESIQNALLKKFALAENGETRIGPIVQHDCVVNTELYDSARCAEVIINAFYTRQK